MIYDDEVKLLSPLVELFDLRHLVEITCHQGQCSAEIESNMFVFSKFKSIHLRLIQIRQLMVDFMKILCLDWLVVVAQHYDLKENGIQFLFI